MALWIVLALMTGAATLLALWPLARAARQAAPADGADDVAVYKDQIDEIGRDRARGLIADGEAEAARAEVARRLLAAADRVERPEGGEAPGGARRRRIAAVVVLAVTPLVSLGVYGALGRPDVPDRPLAARLKGPVDAANVQELVSRVEAELERNPDDGRGWVVLGPVYMRLDRPGDAAAAYANAIRLLGPNAEFEAERGEALVAEAGGIVTAEARAAFERSAAAEPPSLKGVVWLARAKAQDDDPAGALALLKGVFDAAPADAPYRPALKDELRRTAAPPPLPMPDGAAAATAKTPEERMALVRGMVDRLDDRLKGGEGEIGDWLRLVQSRAALGDAEQARAALAAAKTRFGGDARAAARLDALALGLGLAGEGA